MIAEPPELRNSNRQDGGPEFPDPVQYNNDLYEDPKPKDEEALEGEARSTDIERSGNFPNGGWNELSPLEVPLVNAGPCNIPRIQASELSNDDFVQKYAHSQPVVIGGVPGLNEAFQKMCERENFLREMSDVEVNLNSVNSKEYGRPSGLKKMTVRDFVETMMDPLTPQTGADGTFYFFGLNQVEQWDDFFQHYQPPLHKLHPRQEASKSFGVGGRYSGVPFHAHSPTFSEVLHGRKRWFLTPYQVVPEFSHNKTTLQWFLEDYPRISRRLTFYECTVGPGEILYFPNLWWHATINLEPTVMMATFVSPPVT